LGVSNGIPLEEYDRFFTIPFVKKTINAAEIEYTASASYPVEKREYSLLFKDGNTAYPAISKLVIQAKSETTEVVHLVKCGNDKSFPTEIDYMEKHNGELTYHQCIRNIKFGPLPADFVFTPTLLNIPLMPRPFETECKRCTGMVGSLWIVGFQSGRSGKMSFPKSESVSCFPLPWKERGRG